jgi:hypothetical protein
VVAGAEAGRPSSWRSYPASIKRTGAGSGRCRRRQPPIFMRSNAVARLGRRVPAGARRRRAQNRTETVTPDQRLRQGPITASRVRHALRSSCWQRRLKAVALFRGLEISVGPRRNIRYGSRAARAVSRRVVPLGQAWLEILLSAARARTLGQHALTLKRRQC